MALGKLYVPKGEAYETAHQVLQKEKVYACNVAMGCSNACKYCYVGKATRGRVTRGSMEFPAEYPHVMVHNQLERGLKPEGVFLSFLTDPFLPCNTENTIKLVNLLRESDIEVAVLTKLYPYPQYLKDIKYGMTFITYDKDFWREYEPNTLSPHIRWQILFDIHRWGYYTWLSLEPVPPPSILHHNLIEELETFLFVDFIIFGKWNYDKRANTGLARQYYKRTINEFIDFCKTYGIRYHIKKKTMEFAFGGER